MCVTPLVVLEVRLVPEMHIAWVICLSGAHFKDDDAIYAFLGREMKKWTYLKREKYSESAGSKPK